MASTEEALDVKALPKIEVILLNSEAGGLYFVWCTYTDVESPRLKSSMLISAAASAGNAYTRSGSGRRPPARRTSRTRS